MASFLLSVALLMRYRTQDVFRIRCEYHPLSASISKETYSGYLPFIFFSTTTGLSPFVALLSSRLRFKKLDKTQVQTPHCPILSVGLRFVLYPFHSPLLRASQLVSFPAVNKMFQFSAFAILFSEDFTAMRY